jgi:hypothetical protein
MSRFSTQERQPRLEHPPDPADRAHQQADHDPDEHSDDDAGQHPAQRHVEVLPQQVARIAAGAVMGGGDVEESAPHGAWVRHERLIPDPARGGELPDDEEHDQRQHRQRRTGQPATPLA